MKTSAAEAMLRSGQLAVTVKYVMTTISRYVTVNDRNITVFCLVRRMARKVQALEFLGAMS